jgi:bacteriocin biosynthesis cyclodehydratase domain-containing protein
VTLHLRPGLRLRPGLHVARRDAAHLQLGVDPPARAVLRDGPEVRRLLDELAGGLTTTPASAVARRTLADLHRAGLVAEPRPVAPRPVALHAAGDGAGDLVADLHRLLRAGGAAATVVRPAGPVAPDALTVLVALGEPRREDVDAEVRDGRPHLVVSGGPDRVVVGPFVDPGRTACLRCLDAHRSEADPRRGLVLAQLAGRAGGPDDPALVALAAAWAAHDVLTFLAGGSPTTWSATVSVGADLRPERQPWRRHPWCGCAWDVLCRDGDRAEPAG